MHPRTHANTAVRLVAAALATMSCEPRTRQTPDDTLVLVIESGMDSAEPRAPVPAYDARLAQRGATGLTAVDTATMEPRLELASRVERKDDLTIDVTVRDDARFSDGSPVTAADVAGTYMTVLAPESTSGSHKMLSDRLFSV